MQTVQKTLDKQVMSLLDEDQKIVFLKTLLFLSQADGKVDDTEVVFIKKMAQKYKVENVKKIFENVNEPSLLEELKSIESRRVALELIKQLFILGHCDKDLGVEEILFINHAADVLNVSPQKVEEIGRFVVDSLILAEQSKIIFEEN